MNEDAYLAILHRLGIEPEPAPAPRLAHPDRHAAQRVAHMLVMPLDRFARDGRPIEVRVAWWPETLFSPDTRHLEMQGVAPHRVWTATELARCRRAIR